MNETPKVDPKQLNEVAVFKHDRQLLGCRFSPCGEFVFAAGVDNNVHRWHLETGAHTMFAGHGSWIGSLDFHPDKQRMFSADYVGTVHCWRYADNDPKPLWSIKDAHASSIRSVVASLNGKTIATAGHDQLARVWSAKDGSQLHEFAGHQSPIFTSAFHPDGTGLVTAEQFGVVKHWDVESGKHVRDIDASTLWTDASLSGGAHTCGIRDTRFIQDGKTLACAGLTELKDGDRRGGNATVVLLDWETGKQVKTFVAKGAGYVERFVFHSDSLSMAACLTQENGSLQFWNGAAAEPITQVKSPCRDMDLHPDGLRIAVCEWVRHGKVGNNPSTDEPQKFEPHHGAVRIHSLSAAS